MRPEVLPGLVPRDLQALVAQLPGRRQAALLPPALALACVHASTSLTGSHSRNGRRQAPHAPESAGPPGATTCRFP